MTGPGDPIKLGRIADTVSGTGFPHEYQGQEAGDYPFFKVSDFNHPGNEIELSACSNWVDEEIRRHLGARVAPPGAILFPKVGAALLGNARRITTRPSLFDNNIMALIPRAADSRYLYYLMDTIDLGEVGNPGPVPSVGEWTIRDLRFPIPKMAEQRKIADFLDRETSRIDTLVDQRQRMMGLLQERLAAIADSVLWIDETKPLRHLVTGITVGIVVRPASWYVSNDTPGAVPALRATDVEPFSIKDRELVHISAEGNALHLKSQLKANDIVVVRTGNAGAAVVVPAELEGANCISNVIIRCSDRLMPSYLEAVLNSHRAQQAIRAESVGAIQQHFGVEAARALRIPMIDVPDQLQRVRRFTAIRQHTGLLLRSIARQVELLRERRKTIVTAAATGELSVSKAA